jgi:uncharacterized membrane protein
MSLKAAQVSSLLAAVITAGLMAGVFGLYAHTIMRGLKKTDDRTFVAAFQAMDRAIINPLFMLAFFGALLFSWLAVVLYLRGDDHSVVPWVVVAAALYLLVVIITVAVHLPLNDSIKAAGDPDQIADLAAVRAKFHETRWMAWNIVRAVASTAAFACLAWALVLHGRMTGTADSSARPAAIADVTASSFPVPTSHGR